MAIEITTEAEERSTFIVEASFFDDDGDAVTPNADTIKWTLTNASGATVINSRNLVDIASAATVDIVLTGDDLEILESEHGPKIKRIITIQAEYDSDAGTDLNLRDAGIFNVVNSKRVVKA